MKILSKVSMTIPVLLMLSMSAYAQTNDSNVSSDNGSDDEYYIGVKTGMIMIDENHAQSIDDPVNYGAYFGYKFNQAFGVELDYTVSQESDVTNEGGDKGVYDITTYGTYLTYHYPINNTSLNNMPLYAKAKLGVGGAEIDKRYRSKHHSTDGVGLVAGIGLGMQIHSNVALETEFNMLRNDNINTNGLILGANFHF